MRELDVLFCLLEATTGPFGERGREMILTCLQSPTIETWDDVHAFVLVRDPCINFEAAVQAVDPRFEQPKKVRGQDGRLRWQWRKAPSREMLVEALKYAAYRWR
ncbi:MAG TPA: hypothetical protein VFF68_03860 [Anaerolineaceae bacterium]|nr:hypothetical protein [Anaerolineaceae bacterium]